MSTFINQLEKKVIQEGYKNISSYLYFLLIEEGLTFVDIAGLIKEKYGIDYSYNNVYRCLRKYAPIDYSITTRFDREREELAKTKGFSSFKSLLLSFVKRNLNYKEIANELGLKSPINVKRFEKIYLIKLAFNRKTKKAGFKNQARYRAWLEKAKELGYSSIEEALISLKEEGKKAKEIAEIFDISPQALWRIMNRIKNQYP